MKNKFYLTQIAGLVLLVFTAYSCQKGTARNSDQMADFDDVYENIEFDMPRVEEPEFPDYSVNIEDFGAVGDGQFLNTEAFSEAINDVAENGGGTVIIPQGIWLTGPIVLKSNINIHTRAGALVLFSEDKDLYPIIETSYEGLRAFRSMAPIYGKDLENIAFTGEGVFDGSGDAWRPVKKYKMTDIQWRELVSSGGVLTEDKQMWYPSEEALRGSQISGDYSEFNTKEDYEKIKDYLRPVMVSLVNCNRILLDGPTFQNSPAWCIHPLMSQNVTIRNVTVKNPWYSQNGDGLDLESCKNAIIYKNNFDVGDDAICIKSGKNEHGRERNMPTENVIVKENIVYHGHGGFTVGSEMSGGVRNIHVSGCTFIGTDVGLRFKSTRGRGGIVENIYISDIDMVDIPAEPIRFNLFYGGSSPIPEEGEEQDTEKMSDADVPPVTEETPQFRNIFMKNIQCKGAGQAVYMQGLPEMKLQNINFDNVLIEADKGIQCIDANEIDFINVHVKVASEPALHIYNGKDITIDNFQFDEDTGIALKVEGPSSENIVVSNTDFSSIEGQVVKGDNLAQGAVEIK